MRLDYRKTFLIGFGFFASSIAWSLYNSLVPLMLEQRFLLGTAIIGVIMTIDNIFGVVFQPLVGMLSDRTHTRIGKRMPWIAVGIPLCAIAFYFIPRASTLIGMMSVIIGFNFIMSLWRSPVVSLMPDVTPAPLRSKANGIINLMGGIGSIVAFLVGGILADLNENLHAPFILGSGVMLFALAMLLLFVREPDSRMGITVVGEERSAISGKTRHAIKDWQPGEKRSLTFLLLAIFFWFCGYNAVETFFTLYATNTLGVTAGKATQLLTMFSLAFVAFALPSGIIAGRIGRRKVIVAGLIGMVIVFLPMLYIQNILAVQGLLLLGGFFWACININSLPMVVEMATKDRIGSFTGYYYFFSFSAAIASPILFGIIRDLTQNYATLFIYSVIAFAVALGCILFVRHGEAATGEGSAALPVK
jgi:Na+/melibiose symporter-like transporter